MPASELPIAQVVLDLPLAHLDRPFDYLVPQSMSATAAVGSRVRVRFAGQAALGFVLARCAESEHVGRLTPLSAAVSPEPVLTPEIAVLAREVADRYAGTLADVLRLAIPPRHARVEAEPASAPHGLPPRPDPACWQRYPGGAGYLAALYRRSPARAVWCALPGPGWPTEIAAAVAATLAGGRGALVVLPDARDVARVDEALTTALGDHRHVALRADLGPAQRYRRWLAVRRASVRAVVGTRAAMFAPVADLGLVVVWDDGDDLHAEPRAPYPHVRDVLVLRAHQAGAAALVGGFVRTAEGETLLRTGWARALVAGRPTVRAAAPRVQAAGRDAELARDPAARSARLPSLAWQTAREALAQGAPVLVQVPRRGYLPALACDRCRFPTRCLTCAGPLGGTGAGTACRWCGRPVVDWTCSECGGRALRAVVVGARRTAEELGRALPGVTVRMSGRDGVLATVTGAPSLVVATPGAEPVADGGYGAVLLLDGWLLLSRPDLRAGEETLRRWFAAAALARPAAEGGRVVVMADGALAAVGALVGWDPGGAAGRETDERIALGFPPAARLASVTGSPPAVAELLAAAELPSGAELLGPVVVGDGIERILVRVARASSRELAVALKAAQAGRSARKLPDPVRVQLDPLELG